MRLSELLTRCWLPSVLISSGTSLERAMFPPRSKALLLAGGLIASLEEHTHSSHLKRDQETLISLQSLWITSSLQAKQPAQLIQPLFMARISLASVLRKKFSNLLLGRYKFH